MHKLFEIFNINRTKNEEVTKFISLELEINGYIKSIDIVVTNSNSINIFLEYNWLVKHNPDINWNKEKIWFTRCSRT